MARWSDEEVAELRRLYGDDPTKPFEGGLIAFAAKYGRNPGNVSRKAKELGLPTNISRRKVMQRKRRRKTANEEELRALMSQAAKDRIAKHGHPRGMLGKKHSQSLKAASSERSKRMWADPECALRTDEQSQAKSDRMLERVVNRDMPPGHTRARGGRRADLSNRYFRSAWEANYARYLNLLKAQGVIVDWEYEVKTFVFEPIKRGTRAYTPDFLVHKPDGSREWHEVKGYMDQRSRTCLDRMAKYYPGERVVLIDHGFFRGLRKAGMPSLIPHWEAGTCR